MGANDEPSANTCGLSVLHAKPAITRHESNSFVHTYRDCIELRNHEKFTQFMLPIFNYHWQRNFCSMVHYRREKRDMLECTLQCSAMKILFELRCKYMSRTGNNDAFNSNIRVKLHTSVFIIDTNIAGYGFK